MSLKAIDGNGDLIGVCVNTKSCPWDSKTLAHLAENVNHEQLQNLFNIYAIIAHESDLHRRFNTNAIFEVIVQLSSF